MYVFVKKPFYTLATTAIAMKYVVTGGAGFIGSNIVEELVKRGEEVKVIDNLSTGKRENLEGILDKITLVEADICDTELMKKEFDGYDYVLHQAALVLVQESIENPIKTNKINSYGTLSVLLAAHEAGIKRVVFASSAAVYGDNEELPLNENAMVQPLSPYAVTKVAGEQYCKVFSEIYGLETVVLRYFNVFGPRQDPNSDYAAVIVKFIQKMLKAEKPTIYGDGEQTRDFVHVDNVVEANLLACTADNVSGEVFNIASGEKTSVNELFDKLNSSLGTKLEAEHGEERKGDIKHSQADVSKAREMIGYEPKVGFDKGLEKMLA